MSSKDMDFIDYALSDVSVIEMLVEMRYEIENSLSRREDNVMSRTVSNTNEEVLITYMLLDEHIKNSKLNDLQRSMLNMASLGYSQTEIASMAEVPHSRVGSRLKTIYREIKRENDRHWMNHVYKNKMGLKTKMCNKCKMDWVATPEFYSTDSRNADGLQGRCRKCKY